MKNWGDLLQLAKKKWPYRNFAQNWKIEETSKGIFCFSGQIFGRKKKKGCYKKVPLEKGYWLAAESSERKKNTSKGE